ncbi:MAG: hypothetical protein LBM98_09260, partial [Oscillospiraceae bacterium]|nr:hypothetical protein [Oscillospiraceae bacterium]
QPWIASPHNIHYVSQVRWRLRKDGLGEAQPCPGAMRRDGGRGLRPRTARGHHPGATRHPSQEGNLDVRCGETPSLVQPYSPLWRGAARRRRGGFPRRAHPTSKPP